MFSKCELIKIDQLSGYEGSVYTIILDDDDKSEFEKFVNENISSFKNEINDIFVRLKTMGNTTGMREHYFRTKEGFPGDGVCALYFKKKKLRLYCIRYGSQLIVLGGGGPKFVRALQNDPKLERDNYILRELSQKIREKMADGDLKFIDEGLEFEGDFIIETEL